MLPNINHSSLYPKNTIVYANKASDVDSGDYGIVNYRLVRDSKHFFNIDEDARFLRTNKVLDYETDQSNSVHIVAFDMGGVPLINPDTECDGSGHERQCSKI